ncbi:MAG TPA: glycoside hydrolase family 2 TIM barrel-domain containing protein [Opitutaceae bacterium]|jgi:hypothetical protein|nr:glycoside hydrolase family 2 TIM barrel-domain containing protein [Opitutaceae bacterium]
MNTTLARRCRGPLKAASLIVLLATAAFGQRIDMSLDGRWQVAEGVSPNEIPATFSREIPVPGLIDMASPSFASVGAKSDKRAYYWYRRTFEVARTPSPVTLLKINKAFYGTKVFVNGQAVEFNPYCFTPTLVDIRPYLRTDGAPNELVVRVGADQGTLPESVPNGTDAEKITYLSGIYDDVSLILSDYPFIENVQIVPQIADNKIHVVAEVRGSVRKENFRLHFVVSESKGGKQVIEGLAPPVRLEEGENTIAFDVAIAGCRLWSPEDPFLYTLDLATGADSSSHRFGMRDFHFDKERKMAVLNGKPYALLGTNVCIYRFFDDSERGNLPWDENWVRNLHLKFKSMNWNSIRYCIGFPPEKWYDIADETGFLIEDEYPIWGGEEEIKFTVDSIAQEYTRWMRERWNHPCVVIWDGQNETVTAKTGAAIARVRDLDLSRRPWDNGWSAPQRADDPIESHPYRFYIFNGKEAKNKPSDRGYEHDIFGNVEDRADNSPNTRVPGEKWAYPNPVIINEYDWLWLNRDGSPTYLTENVYRNLFGEGISVDQLRKIHAETVGMLTEYWRCRRQAAGVMHFCGLGYSRPAAPKGQTSDDFIDIKNLTFEPHFFKEVREKFEPVCLMLNAWENKYPVGGALKTSVYAINDSNEPYEGTLKLAIVKDGVETTVQSKPIRIEGSGQSIVEVEIPLPSSAGDCRLTAQVNYKGIPIESVRKFAVR